MAACDAPGLGAARVTRSQPAAAAAAADAADAAATEQQQSRKLHDRLWTEPTLPLMGRILFDCSLSLLVELSVN